MKRKMTFIKTVRGMVFIAVITVIGLSMIACATSGSGGGGSKQSIITVTNIPSQYNGKVGFITVDHPSNDAWAMVTISGGQVTFPLLDWSKNQPYQVNGSYVVNFLISDTINDAAAGITVYQGMILSKNVGRETTTMSFGEFISTR